MTELNAELAPAIEYREAGNYRQAILWLQQFLTAQPLNAEAMALLVQVLLLDNQIAAAETTLQKAMALAPQVPAVLRNHSRLLLKQQKAGPALQVAQQAMVVDSQNHETCLVMVAALLANGQMEPALPLLQQVLKVSPNYAEAYAIRASLRLQRGDTPGALMDLKTALKLKPHLVPLRMMLIQIYQQQKNYPAVIEALRAALAQDPNNAAYQTDLGEYLRLNHQVEEAISVLQNVVTIAPDYPFGWSNLGTALHSAGRIEDAKRAYEHALKLKPDLAWAAHNLGAIAKDAESWEIALQHFEQAIQYQPENARLLASKGVALINLGCSLAEIEALVQKIHAISPGDEAGFNLLGEYYKNAGRLADAADCFRKSLQASPNSLDAMGALAEVLTDQGKITEAQTYSLRVLELKPDHEKALSRLLFSENYLDTSSPRYRFELAQRYGALVSQKASSQTFTGKFVPGKQKLRVGMVSGDFNNHPVGYFLESFLPFLHRGNVDLIAYPTQTKADGLTERLKKQFSAWVPLYGKSDETAAQQIHRDDIDVLIDLSGHTRFNRLPVFAYKPAPLQVSWLGYFATTGVPQIDYLIADEVSLPASEQESFTETIWYLPDTRLCFSAPEDAPAVSGLPALKNGHVTFGSFQRLAKINDAVIGLWARVLAAIPDARLRLQNKQLGDADVAKRFMERLKVHGVPPERVSLHGGANRRDYLAAHAEVDIILDTSPYPGGTTTCEALWMGVPTLTLLGNHFIGRQGAGLLHAAGLGDWVAKSDDEYCQKAVEFGSDLTALASLRKGLRDRVAVSPLFDGERFAGHFEEVLWVMWKGKSDLR